MNWQWFLIPVSVLFVCISSKRSLRCSMRALWQWNTHLYIHDVRVSLFLRKKGLSKCSTREVLILFLLLLLHFHLNKSNYKHILRELAALNCFRFLSPDKFIIITTLSPGVSRRRADLHSDRPCSLLSSFFFLRRAVPSLLPGISPTQLSFQGELIKRYVETRIISARLREALFLSPVDGLSRREKNARLAAFKRRINLAAWGSIALWIYWSLWILCVEYSLRRCNYLMGFRRLDPCR